MKLRTRQTLLSLFIILLVMSGFLYVYVGLQTNRLLADTRTAGMWQLNAFKEHVAAIDRTAVLENDAALTTRQALVQYTFSTYAHLLQSTKKAFSLASGDAYLYNLSKVDPLKALPMPENIISANRMLKHEGRLILVSSLNLRVLDLPFTFYLTEDISDVEEEIAALTRTSQVALLISLFVCALLLPPLIRRSLAPLETLSHVAGRIAEGGYSLRSNILTEDEVGALSRSFDRMADTVEEKISRLEKTNKNQQLLIGALTHELKTPMTAIIGFSDSLLTMPLSEEEKAEALEQIHRAAHRTERLSQKMMQLISLSGEELPDKKPVKLATLLHEADISMEEKIKQAGLSLRFEKETGLDILYGDADLLFSALTNLLDNAVKASSPGQEIVVKVKKEGQHLIFSVQDQGRGIPKEELPHLTRPFYRVDKARSRKLGGVGLGLALCQLIARAHGGGLSIESELGKGTTVSIKIPEGKSHA